MREIFLTSKTITQNVVSLNILFHNVINLCLQLLLYHRHLIWTVVLLSGSKAIENLFSSGGELLLRGQVNLKRSQVIDRLQSPNLDRISGLWKTVYKTLHKGSSDILHIFSWQYTRVVKYDLYQIFSKEG